MKNLMSDYRDPAYGFLPLQNSILRIAQYVDVFCDEHDIYNCLMSGSALGAVRHKGFIPWDDDLDFFMTPDSYDKFRKMFFEKGDKENYYLQEWGGQNGKVSIAKLRLNKSTYIEKDLRNWDMHHGVYVDIFILHTCPDNKFKRYYQYLWAKYLVMKGAANRGYDKKGGFIGFALKCMQLTPKKMLVDFALNQIYRFRNEKSKYLCHFMGRALLNNGLYKRTYFEKTKKVDFETIKLNVPYNVEEYLSDRWGDYMKLPSEEEIKKYQHSWKWSETEYFDNYKKNHLYKDECNLIG